MPRLAVLRDSSWKCSGNHLHVRVASMQVPSCLGEGPGSYQAHSQVPPAFLPFVLSTGPGKLSTSRFCFSAFQCVPGPSWSTVCNRNTARPPPFHPVTGTTTSSLLKVHTYDRLQVLGLLVSTFANSPGFAFLSIVSFILAWVLFGKGKSLFSHFLEVFRWKPRGESRWEGALQVCRCPATETAGEP